MLPAQEVSKAAFCNHASKILPEEKNAEADRWINSGIIAKKFKTDDLFRVIQFSL